MADKTNQLNNYKSLVYIGKPYWRLQYLHMNDYCILHNLQSLVPHRANKRGNGGIASGGIGLKTDIETMRIPVRIEGKPQTVKRFPEISLPYGESAADNVRPTVEAGRDQQAREQFFHRLEKA